MALTSGTRLGPYEITGSLGEGGMGEVYRARDTRLDRTVAVKILPATLASDPDRRQRFEREARVIASLSHPNICALHDVGSAPAPDAGAPLEFLVMEYLDGETLAARLSRGALPLDEVIRIGIEMAIALDAAHRLRIVHRDLKPANVMLTRSGVKLLDFGLAKAADIAVQASASTTMASAVTSVGTVLGTLPYMAPEQIEGRDTDARTDIFAFGAVLYEMAAGRRAFAGDTAAAVASAILSADAPSLRVSSALDKIVRACLEKDPDRRWHSAHDVAMQLRDVVATDRLLATRAPVGTRTALPWVVAAIGAAIALGASTVAWRARAAGEAGAGATIGTPVRFTIPPPDGGYFAIDVERPAVAMSPDGEYVAYAGGVGDGEPSVWLRALSSDTAKILPGTEGASGVFWSPDGKAIGFFAGGQLKRVAIAGGAPVKVCDARQWIGQTGTWGDGVILFASVDGSEIVQVPAAGGTPVALVARDPAKKETRVAWPAFLPDGRRFFYMIGGEGTAGTIRLGSLDGPSRDVLPIRSNAQYVEPGFILYGQDGALLARRFDLATGSASGEPVPVAETASQFLGTGLAQFSASRNGAVVVHTGENLTRVVLFDRTGAEASVIRQASPYESIRLSRDGRDLYLDRREPKTGTLDIWRLEMDRGAESRVTSDPGSEINPVFARDGSLIFSAARGGAPRLYRRPPAGPDEPLAASLQGMQVGADLSPDGKWVLYQQRAERGKFDLVAVSLPDLRTVPFQASDAAELRARFSPDGKYVAFLSDLGGRPDIYVAPFPGPGPSRIVSTVGGIMPRWSADGSQLFYVAVDGALYSTAIRTSPALEIGPATRLFTRGSRARWISYEPTADGRFIALEPVVFGAEQPLHVILNWPALAFGGTRAR